MRESPGWAPGRLKFRLSKGPFHDNILGTMTDEKRKYLRFELVVPVDLVDVEGVSRADAEVILDNVSREGLRLVMDVTSPFGPGTELSFRFKDPTQGQVCNVTGEVVWSKSAGEKMELGLKIKSISNCAKADLLEMGYTHWKEEHTPPKKTS
jgi:hypothetical protein